MDYYSSLVILVILYSNFFYLLFFLRYTYVYDIFLLFLRDVQFGNHDQQLTLTITVNTYIVSTFHELD
jgi:hypothetical protein